jgi:hypothetical protein
VLWLVVVVEETGCGVPQPESETRKQQITKRANDFMVFPKAPELFESSSRRVFGRENRGTCSKSRGTRACTDAIEVSAPNTGAGIPKFEVVTCKFDFTDSPSLLVAECADHRLFT